MYILHTVIDFFQCHIVIGRYWCLSIYAGLWISPGGKVVDIYILLPHWYISSCKTFSQGRLVGARAHLSSGCPFRGVYFIWLCFLTPDIYNKTYITDIYNKLIVFASERVPCCQHDKIKYKKNHDTERIVYPLFHVKID